MAPPRRTLALADVLPWGTFLVCLFCIYASRALAHQLAVTPGVGSDSPSISALAARSDPGCFDDDGEGGEDFAALAASILASATTSATETVTTIATASSTSGSASTNESAQIYSRTTSAVIAGVTPVLALAYVCPLYLVYRDAKRHPRAVNKVAGARVQVWAPMVYGFLVVSSLAEVALAAWLLLQYRFNNNAPNISVLTGTRILLFAGCWTCTIAGTYALLFLDPAWSRRPIASVGAQAVWIMATWVAWVVGATLLNHGAPELFVGVGAGAGACEGVVYCGQVQTLFAFSLLETLTLTFAMLIMVWLGCRATIDAR